MIHEYKDINPDWLGVDIPDDKVFNPLEFVFKDNNLEEAQKRLYVLMMNPDYFSFVCKFILNVELLPFQAVMLKEFWNRKFPMLIGSRGLSKSYTIAIYIILRCLLIPKRKVVVVGAAFRQSKVIFNYVEEIINNAPVLRSMMDSNSGVTKGTDMCTVTINKSVAKFLPLGDGEKIRGQRAHDVICDEMACLSAGSLVETENGLVRIEDFESVKGLKVVTGDESLTLEPPERFIKTKKTDVYEIKLQNGYTIKCSENHQVMTSNGWKKPLELSKGDWIEKSKDFIFGTKTDYLSHDLCWLMGLLVSEGSIVNKKTISIATTNIDLVNRIVEKFKWKVNVRPAYTDSRYGWKCKELYSVYINDEPLRELLFSLGLDYVTSHHKKIPQSILSAPKEYILSFLGGLFDGDGSCFIFRDKKVHNAIGLSYYSVSERLCRDVHILMNRLGYDGLISSRDSKISKNKQWMVRWINKTAKEAAIALNVPRFQHAIDSCSIPKDSTNITFDKNRNKWKVSIQYLDKTIQKRFATKEEAEEFVSGIKNKNQYRKVLSVRKLDDQEHLYDYYLPITHSFYAEGHRQHNSVPIDIFERVVAGFGNVAQNPVQKVKDKMRQKYKVKTKNNNKYEVGNQIVMSGTAYYSFNHFCKYHARYKQWIETKGDKRKINEITKGDKNTSSLSWEDYCIMRIPVDLLPPGLMDDGMIARLKSTVSESVAMMELYSCFSNDSDGFFKRKLIETCVVSETNPIILNPEEGPIFFQASTKGRPGATHIFGVDPAASKDNFSIVVLETNPTHRRIVYCWTTNLSRHREAVKKNMTSEVDYYRYCSRKLRDLMVKFPCTEIAIDTQGGGRAIIEALKDLNHLKAGEVPIYPVIDEDKEKDTDDKPGLHIIRECNNADANWLSEANHGMRKDFEDKMLLFPHFDTVTLELSYFEDEQSNNLYDTLEDCVLNIEELKDELSSIIISQTPAGREKWDTPETKTDVGKKITQHKDRYSALMMANMSARREARINPFQNYSVTGGVAGNMGVEDLFSSYSTDYYPTGPDWWVSSMRGFNY